MASPAEQVFIDLGYNAWVAEALAGHELSVESVQTMEVDDILDYVFTWHGFIGFTSSIINAVDNVRNVEAL